MGYLRRKRTKELARKAQPPRINPPRIIQRDGILATHLSPLKLPEKVILLASGIKGVEHYDSISEDDFVVAVQGAVTAPEVHKKNFKVDIWFTQDPRSTQQDWFRNADAKYKGIRVFSVQAAGQTPSFTRAEQGKFYTFDLLQEPEYNKSPWRPLGQRFRVDTTVSGSALYFCKLCGVKVVDVIGLDMEGDKYHTGVAHPHKKNMAIWPTAKRLEEEIEWLNHNGLTVETLSPTALRNVPWSAQLKSPREIYVVGPGPQGKPFHNTIPEGAYVVVLNSAALIDGVKWRPRDWCVADKDAVLKPYWIEALRKFAGKKVFSNEVCNRARVVADYQFPIDTPDGFMYRSAGTVAGVVLWLYYISGTRKFNLVGIDMSGNQYFDGTSNTDPRWLGEHGEIWRARDVLDARIRYLQKWGGVEVISLSPTKLRSVTEQRPSKWDIKDLNTRSEV